ncbi:malate synthase A [Solitalea koreensis]|uniref:Malate synthase n=1 Tax=Solitalea koreensis TaxID=543615 RepID=A0A521CJ63_9SPHI|nr:malate synthase A [Solitalea koreensis]SMO59432.1 malate synthase [Solitalea koreensis]
MENTISQPLVAIRNGYDGQHSQLLTPAAIEFMVALHRNFEETRRDLLCNRMERQRDINNGQMPDFLPETEWIRSADWKVASTPADLQNRKVEITGPVDRKMIINGLNSGANVYMADFEDATSPTWENVIEGQQNLYHAIRRKIDFETPEGKSYKLNDKTAVLMVRPRGWHLDENHFQVDGRSISASLFDFGLYFFHNAHELIRRGTAPYFYLPKLESHLEARLWNQVFEFAQEKLGIPHGMVKCTVLIETILAAFEMDEILFELRDHITGLNAGRWDYIFSIIKKFRLNSRFILPDRSQVTMRVPFMHAYTQLLVQTCHKRGAHAMGGMAAFIPSRKDEDVNLMTFEKVKEDKDFEVANGFDGTWVAHPDLIAVARASFDKALGDKPHQKYNLLEDIDIKACDLLNIPSAQNHITEQGIRLNINVGIRYIASWLNGVGAAAINNLMEDAATAEISRAQVWQWIRHGSIMANWKLIDRAYVSTIIEEEKEKLRAEVGEEGFHKEKFLLASCLFSELIFAKQFPEFLTLLAYPYIQYND